jgi:hypothetical protein
VNAIVSVPCSTTKPSATSSRRRQARRKGERDQ